MLRVAAGEALTIKQEDLKPRGWAIESRVYAEDPLRGFLPSIGDLHRYQPPDEEDVLRAVEGVEAAPCTVSSPREVQPLDADYEGVVRCDDGIVEGGEISIHYDPMISKLVTHGRDREHARQLMIAALDRYIISGVRHNVNFLRSLMVNQRFADADLTTAFIPQEYPDGYDGHVLSADERADLLATAGALQCAADGQARSAADLFGAASFPPLSVGLEGEGARELHFEGPEHGLAEGSMLTVCAAPRAATDEEAACDGWERTLHMVNTGLQPSGLLEVDVAGGDGAPRPFAVQVLERRRLGWQLSAFGTMWGVNAAPQRFAAMAQHMKPPAASALDDALLSPMPGILISVSVEPGAMVAAGQELCVVEAMKMQNVLLAERDGQVSELLAEAGSTLAADQPILMFEAQPKKAK
jgi:propionyl-CoA carboxylase alpha chain